MPVEMQHGEETVKCPLRFDVTKHSRILQKQRQKTSPVRLGRIPHPVSQNKSRWFKIDISSSLIIWNLTRIVHLVYTLCERRKLSKIVGFIDMKPEDLAEVKLVLSSTEELRAHEDKFKVCKNISESLAGTYFGRTPLAVDKLHITPAMEYTNEFTDSYGRPSTNVEKIVEQCKICLTHLPMKFGKMLKASLIQLNVVAQSLNELDPAQVPVVHEFTLQNES